MREPSRVRAAPDPGSSAGRGFPRILRLLSAPATTGYIGVIALIAHLTGLDYVLFPELGALAHDVLKRPHGTWARALGMLVLTPALTAVVGTVLTRHLAYSPVSVLLSVGTSIAIIRVLRSPIAPAISAGLLPLTLGITSWLYAPSILIGTVLLAAIATGWTRLAPAPEPSVRDLADDITERTPARYSWVPFFLGFLVVAALLAGATGWRLLLFPPLVVMGFEMFAHPAVCPWAARPIVLPVACALTATGGLAAVGLLGVGPLAAMASILFGIAVLRGFDLHVPPALAVGLLPFVIVQPDWRFPVAVGLGTAMLTSSFLLWRAMPVRRP
ncbi:MAG: hypothetical protein KGL52_03970 [Rhodospirillales bacterium]|jgi:hypothetical protein|nr:hypothetical protein [Rhodospirillales bacterium]